VTHLLDHRKNPGHSVVITVRANTQIDLLRVLVGTVRGHQTKQRVFRRLLHRAKSAHTTVGRHVDLVVDLAESLCRSVIVR
jgi:hypothetical protein